MGSHKNRGKTYDFHYIIKMCLAIPGKIIKIEKTQKKRKFIIDYGSEIRTVEMSVVPVKLGDYVIVSNKIIVTKLEKDKAEDFLKILK